MVNITLPKEKTAVARKAKLSTDAFSYYISLLRVGGRQWQKHFHNKLTLCGFLLLTLTVQNDEARRKLTDKGASLVSSLKLRVSRLESTLKDKEAELAKLQASAKATALNELKIEAETYYQEVSVNVEIASTRIAKACLIQYVFPWSVSGVCLLVFFVLLFWLWWFP